MKKTLASLAVASLVVALGMLLVVPAHAQTYNSNGSGSSLNADNSSTTTTTNNSSNSTSTMGTTTRGTTSTTTGTGTPGLPNTGAGGNAATNAALLFSSGLIAVGGGIFLARRLAL